MRWMRDYFQDLRERILKDLENVLSDGLKIFYKNEKCKKSACLWNNETKVNLKGFEFYFFNLEDDDFIKCWIRYFKK